jgi:hypothetical protein
MNITAEKLGEIIRARFAAHGLAGYAMRDLKASDIGGAFHDAIIHALAAEHALAPGWELDFDESDKAAGEAAADKRAKDGFTENECMEAFFTARRDHMIFRKIGI